MPYEARFTIRIAAFVPIIIFMLLASFGLLRAGAFGVDLKPNVVEGGAMAALALGAAAIFAWRLINREVRVRVDEKGVYSAHFSKRTIPWAAIESAWIGHAKRIPLLRLQLVDADVYPPSGLLSKIVRGFERGKNLGSFSIDTSALDHGFDELLAAMHSYRPDLAARPGMRDAL